jgi:hypothetical protein
LRWRGVRLRHSTTPALLRTACIMSRK